MLLLCALAGRQFANPSANKHNSIPYASADISPADTRSDPEDGGSTFPRNVGRPAEVPDYTMWHARLHLLLTDISINSDLCFGGVGDRFGRR